MNLMPGIEATASALNAEKMRMDLIGQNIANANTTRGPDGKPYQRQLVAFESKLIELGQRQDGSVATGQAVAIRDIRADPSPGPTVYNPGHPDADEKGMVRMPNVNLTHEMVDMIAASRSYEANLQVVRTSKQMAEQALRIARS